MRNKPLVYVPSTPRAVPVSVRDRRSLGQQQGASTPRAVPVSVRASLLRRIPGILWRSVRRTCTALGALVLGLSLFGLFLTLRVEKAIAPALPKAIVLQFDIDGDVPEKEKEVTFSDPFSFRRLSMLQLTRTIDAAAADPRVKGMVARLKDGQMGLAHIQELRAALHRFRKAGKFAYIYGTDYGTPGRGLGVYYLASAFEKIWMQPLGTLSIAGIGIESPYLKALLDKVGVRAEFFQRKAYKTAFENLTHAEMTPENREMMTRMAQDMGEEIVSDIATDRSVDPKVLRRQIDKALLLGKEALAGKLLDRVDYEDALFSEVKTRIGISSEEDLPFVAMETYHAAISSSGQDSRAGAPPVVLIYATGAIVENSDPENESPLLMGSQTCSAEDIAQAIEDATADPDVPAIVLRIDSPGGSPVASETIRRALLRAQVKGKKVIVSMGDVAASGGYWIAAPADAIFALPATLTGSIGVVGGKFDLSGLWEKTGVRWDRVQWGENAGFWTFNAPFSPAGAERMNAMLDEIYDAFISRVAEGRKMSPDQVEKIAGGRVWTGVRAQKVGLVDTLGGLDDALDYTARQIGLADRRNLDVVILPRPRSPIERLLQILESQGSSLEAWASVSVVGRWIVGAMQGAERSEVLVLSPSLSRGG